MSYHPTPKLISLMVINGTHFMCSFDQVQEYINEMRGYRDKKKHLKSIAPFFSLMRTAVKSRHKIRKRLN